MKIQINLMMLMMLINKKENDVDQQQEQKQNNVDQQAVPNHSSWVSTLPPQHPTLPPTTALLWTTTRSLCLDLSQIFIFLRLITICPFCFTDKIFGLIFAPYKSA